MYYMPTFALTYARQQNTIPYYYFILLTVLQAHIMDDHSSVKIINCFFVCYAHERGLRPLLLLVVVKRSLSH